MLLVLAYPVLLHTLLYASTAHLVRANPTPVPDTPYGSTHATGTCLPYSPTRAQCNVRYWHSVPACMGYQQLVAAYPMVLHTLPYASTGQPRVLRLCYAMSGTGVAYGAMSRDTWYAPLSAYAHAPLSAYAHAPLSYAMPGTDRAFAYATQCA
eukprot:3940492-Rhodomonas_salina.1